MIYKVLYCINVTHNYVFQAFYYGQFNIIIINFNYIFKCIKYFEIYKLLFKIKLLLNNFNKLIKNKKNKFQIILLISFRLFMNIYSE